MQTPGGLHPRSGLDGGRGLASVKGGTELGRFVSPLSPNPHFIFANWKKNKKFSRIITKMKREA